MGLKKGLPNLLGGKMSNHANVRVRKTLRSHGHQLEEGPRKTIETVMAHQNLAYYLLSCENGLAFGMFLSGGRLPTFLDLGKSSSKQAKELTNRCKGF